MQYKGAGHHDAIRSCFTDRLNGGAKRRSTIERVRAQEPGLAAGAPTSEVALAGFAIAGAGVSLAAPTFLGLAPGVVPEAPSTAMSSVTTISYLGFVISPPAVGAVADVAGLRAGLLVLVASGLALAMGTLARARLGGAPE